MKNFMNEFKTFIMRGNVLDLAVGYFSGVDGKGFLQIFQIAAHTSGATL